MQMQMQFHFFNSISISRGPTVHYSSLYYCIPQITGHRDAIFGPSLSFSVLFLPKLQEPVTIQFQPPYTNLRVIL